MGKSMKVKELIEELKKYPDNSDIEVKSYDEKFNKIIVKKNGRDVLLYIQYIDEYGHLVR